MDSLDPHGRDLSSGWVLGYTGRPVWPCDPYPDDFTVEDIARGLSARFRYGGHTTDLYTVAEHSVIVSRFAAKLAPPGLELSCAREGLLHDAAEAYLVDMPRPVKVLPVMAAYRLVEATLQEAIFQRFDVARTERTTQIVTAVDNRILIDEVTAISPTPERYLCTPFLRTLQPLHASIVCLAPDHAAHVFLQEFEKLFPEMCQ